MLTRARSLWAACLAVAYVCFAAIQADPRAPLPWVALLCLPALLIEIWRRTETPRQPGETRIDPGARRALRVCFWGGAMWLSARSGPSGRAAFDVAANLGSGVACVASLLALGRVPSIGGVLVPPRSTRSLDAAAFAALLWAIAVALPLTRAALPPQLIRLDPLAIDYATTSASLGGLLILVAATWRLCVVRRLEIGVADRAAGALALAVTALSIAVPAAGFDVAPPDRVLPAALIAAAIACTWTATTPEPTTVSSALRGILAVMILGAPTTIALGLLARHRPEHAGAIVLATSTMSIAIGLIARAVAKPLGPEQSRWLEAIDAASRGALQPEPDAAIRAALAALSRASGSAAGKPELWRNDPEEVLSVDVAGYLHVEKGQAPERIYELALGEPERTLRADVVSALEVRRPDVRPLAAWFETRRAFSATLVLDEDGPLGFLLLPRGNRTSVMTLEEARAVRVLADRISALLAVSSALARSRERELAAVSRADQLDDERHRLEHIILHEGGRYRAQAERLSHVVKRTAYSPAARMTMGEIERLGRLNANVTLQLPLGTRAEGWAALLHLSSPRQAGPLIVIDGASGIEHELARWEHEIDSPLRLADGGTLLILDAGALPLAVQEYLARALARQTSLPRRSNVLPAGLIVTTHSPLRQLLSEGRLHEQLARWLGESAVTLPSLAERPEDLRAITLDFLARTGLRQDGIPLGIDPSAQKLLCEHSWPAGELELEALLIRAAAVAEGPALLASDLLALGFRPIEVTTEAAALAPVIKRRRPRPRRVG